LLLSHIDCKGGKKEKKRHKHSQIFLAIFASIRFGCHQYTVVWRKDIENMNSQCLTAPIVPSCVLGGAFSAIDVLTQGARFTPNLLMTNVGGLYCYWAIQCPMEAIHGRQSAFHNVLAGATIGYLGVANGRLGVPFVDYTFFYRNPNISPPLAGALVYGLLGGAFAMIGGKPW
jgi:hypothetical protein